jgi:UPF0176 protein
MQKILLYYKFVPIADPEAIRLWQRALCEKLNIKGRILISEHGINGTVGGELNDLKRYAREMKEHDSFSDIMFKWSEGSRDHFPKLKVKVRPEIVTFGALDEIEVNEQGVVGGGQKLKPDELHQLLKERDDVVFFDGRNSFEAAVGKFKQAVVPAVRHSRDFPTELADSKYDDIRDKPVVTYCTGGIRCEVLSMLMKKRGFQEVYQLDGGIVKYGEAYGDDGEWEGSLHVFDDRMGIKFSDKAKDIGLCVHCAGKTSNYENCANKECNALILVCAPCAKKTRCPACETQPVTI